MQARTLSPVAEARGTNVVVIALVAALALGAVLTMFAFRAPGGATFEVGTITGATCPAGTGAPVCFQVPVRNTGDHPGRVRCQATPAAGTTAALLSGSSVYTSAWEFGAGGPFTLFVKVDAANGTTVLAPSVAAPPA